MNSYVPTLLLAGFAALLWFGAWILRAAVRIRADRERAAKDRQLSLGFDDSYPRVNHG